MPTKQAPKHGYWRGDTLWARIKVGGAEHRETLRTSDSREAARRVKEIRQRLQREAVLGKPVEAVATPPGHLWAEATERWIREVLPGAVKPAVLKRYKVSLGQLAPVFGKLTIEAITSKSVSEYVSSRSGTVSNATVRRDLTALSRLLAACVSWGWREDNPAAAYDRSMVRERREPIHPPHPADVAKFIAAAPHGMAACLRLLDETGMRMAEAAQLERWQVDEVRQQITLTRTKTSRPRTLGWKTPGGDATAALAAGHPEGFLYRNRGGKPHVEFSSNAFRVMRDLIEREKAAGRQFRPFRVHDLRHAFAVRALKAGMSIYALSRHLGHSSVTTTERHYLGFLTWEEQEAVRQAGAVQLQTQGSEPSKRAVPPPEPGNQGFPAGDPFPRGGAAEAA